MKPDDAAAAAAPQPPRPLRSPRGPPRTPPSFRPLGPRAAAALAVAAALVGRTDAASLRQAQRSSALLSGRADPSDEEPGASSVRDRAGKTAKDVKNKTSTVVGLDYLAGDGVGMKDLKPEQPSIDAIGDNELKSADPDAAAAEAERALRKKIDKTPVWKNMGVKFNSNDDWRAFLYALCLNGAMVTVCILLFSVWRLRFRLVYSKNAWDNWGYSDPELRAEIVDGVRHPIDDSDAFPSVSECGNPLPARPEGYFFDWFAASWRLRTKEVIGTAGLDQAMLIQLTNLGMITFGTIAIPMCFIIAPMHATLGGNASGDDYLSWQGFANVEHGSKLCWVHAFLVWFVVVTVDRNIYKCQEKFVKCRVAWLKEMPHIQACSVLVESIPQRYCTPDKLRQYFNEMFGGREVVEEVNLVVHTQQLLKLIDVRDKVKAKLAAKKHNIKEAEAAAAAASRESGAPSPRRASLAAAAADLFEGSLAELQQGFAIAQAHVTHEQQRLIKEIHKMEQKAEEHMDDTSSENSAPFRAVTGLVTGLSRQESPEDPPPQEDPQEEDKEVRRERAASTIQRHWKEHAQQNVSEGHTQQNQRASLRKNGTISRNSLTTFSNELGFQSLFAKKQQEESEFTKTVGTLYTKAAFVTFRTRYDASMALRVIPYTPDREEFQLSVPPDPSDVIYSDFMQDKVSAKAWESTGYSLMIGLGFVFLPTISFISSRTKVESLAEFIPAAGVLAQEYPKVASMWNGMAGAMGLNIVLAFLPTMLVLITSACFTLKANAWAQHHLQRWYFVFLIVFQLLVVAVANSVENTLRNTIESPLSLIQNLSFGMCRTTHFFLSVFLIQAASIGMEHTRYVQLIKYLLWKKVCDTPQEAHASAEPEDQDFYGMGARSARYTAQFVIGIAFVSLCPLICVLALIYFFLLRVTIGYQVVFAETKKADLGGEFWVTSLKHLQFGLIVYILVMSAVLYERASPSKYPMLVAASSLFYMIESIVQFDVKFFWEKISHEEVMATQRREEAGEATDMRKATRDTYKQPELLDGQ